MASTALTTAGRPVATSAVASLAKSSPHDTGRHVYIYCHVRTKQTVYSLTRVLRETRALKQIPFLGKKTKEVSIRPDFWRPLATVSFPTNHQGIQAYRQLREFKIRHEHEWKHRQLKTNVVYDRKGRPHYDIADAGRRLMDQKANTIADLAFVLKLDQKQAYWHSAKSDEEQAEIQGALRSGKERLVQIKRDMAEQRNEAVKGDVAALAGYRALRLEKMRLKRHLKLPRPDKAMAGQWHPLNDKTELPKRGARKQTRLQAQVPRYQHGVKIAWANMRDSEFARQWPDRVEHDQLENGTSRNLPESPHLLEARREARAAEKTQDQSDTADTDAPQEKLNMRGLVDRLAYGAGQTRPLSIADGQPASSSAKRSLFSMPRGLLSRPRAPASPSQEPTSGVRVRIPHSRVLFSTPESRESRVRRARKTWLSERD